MGVPVFFCLGILWAANAGIMKSTKVQTLGVRATVNLLYWYLYPAN